MTLRKWGLSPISKGDCPHFRGFTFLEVILVIAMLAVLTGGSWLVLKGFWLGRSVETSAENLAALIRTAQLSSKETESAQKILLAREEAVWMRDEEIIRRQRFKNDVKIEELEIKGGSVEVPEEPIANIGILIDERGNADSASIVLAKGKETAHVSVGGQISTSGGGSLGILDVVIPANAGIHAGEDVLIVQTEPLLARGWQVINVNNVDRVKEVKLRVKLDPKLPASAHLHAYVFPGWYENKPVAHGITGEQTMLHKKGSKMGTVPDFGDCPHFNACNDKQNMGSVPILYRESTEDCLVFFNGFYTITATLTNELGAPIVGMPMNGGIVHTNENGACSGQVSNNSEVRVEPDHSYTLNGYAYYSIPTYYSFPAGTTLNQTANFIMYRNVPFLISGFVLESNNTPISDVMINIDHVPIDFTNYGITIASDSGGAISGLKTEENGSYNIPAVYTLNADHFYSIKPIKQGYVFIPETATLFLNNNKTQNFIGIPTSIGNPFSDNKSPMGNWSASESQIASASISTSVPVFGNAIGYYIYKSKVDTITQPFRYYNATQTLPMGDYITGEGNVEILTEQMPNNTLNPGALSDFATKQANLVYENTVNYDNARWEKGFVQSSFASQSQHTLNTANKEIQSNEYSEWLTIQVSSLPAQTKFLRIAIAAYHKDSGEEKLFNVFPTNSSKNVVQNIINLMDQDSILDYQTDPFIIYNPWKNNINDRFWLSHYAYVLKPILRPYGVNVLANKGPVTGENYRNTGSSYKGFWYGPVYLDWDLILGNENIYWLIGWTSGAFELTSSRWRFTQLGDTYGNTASVPACHYLLKNFAYLSYWYLFQHAAYFPSEQNLPKRLQEPISLSRTAVPAAEGGWMKLFERADTSPSSAPWESSSLAIPFMENSIYPIWQASLPAVFGQGKISSAPDLFSSYYYLQERINHTMLDIGIWTIITDNGINGPNLITAARNIFGVDVNLSTGAVPVSPTLGNIESWSVGGDTMSAWWPWYEKIPWAKGQAFPKKTGPLPTDITQRIGWENPVISSSNYEDYFNSPLTYKNDPISSYNAIQVVNAPHTIFMSTAHYPLGSIQVVIKKK